MTSALYSQLLAKMTQVLKTEDGSGFAQAERMHSAILATDNEITVAKFLEQDGEYALRQQGYVLSDSEFMNESVGFGPNDFDSDEEYHSALEADKTERGKLKIVKLDDVLVETVNYKGEGMKFVLKACVKNMPKFVSKNHSFDMF